MIHYARFLGVMVTLLPPLVAASEIEIHIEARIDGRDRLIVQGGTLQWHHLEYAAVGRHDGRNDPTLVTTFLHGEKLLDREAWVPDWPEDPPSWVQFEALSSKFVDLTPILPEADLQVRLEFEAREPPQLVELPTAANGYRIVVEFWDPQEGDDVHKVRLLIDPPPPRFSRGDATSDGQLNIVDPIAILDSLFLGGTLGCHDAADVDDNGKLEITDAVGLLGYLFLGTAAPQAPFPACGVDVVDDGLDCGQGCR